MKNASLGILSISLNAMTPIFAKTETAHPFPLTQVHLLPGPFEDRQKLNARYLLEVVEPDRLLSGFRTQAGLATKAERYGGWEARGINGHSLGHYLSALSALAASSEDEAVRRLARERVDYIVSELAECQRANGDGYVLPVDKRIYDELRSGKIDASGFSLNGEWVPNYTLHKVLAGLRDAYRLAGNEKALIVEKALADYLGGVYTNLSPVQAQEILKSEFGGMNEVFADLSVDTGDPAYLRLAETIFHHDAVLNPLEQGTDNLNGMHANTQVPKILGLARDYLLTGKAGARNGVDIFWDSVVHHRSFANGGHGDHEHFFPSAQFASKLGPQNAETCNTHNMIKLAGMRFSWSPDAGDMDFVERGLINHLLANIGRQPGEFGYFLPFGDVAYKTFSTPESSWWCCVGTGMENPARYAEQAYFHRGDTLWINLYIASELNWAQQGVTLRQETAFPESDTVRLVIATSQPRKLTLKFRHPYWCSRPEAALNGSPVPVDSKPSSYWTIEREWREGDVLTLRLPMAPHVEPLPETDGKILALMYGPLQIVAIVPSDPAAPDPARQRYSDHLKSPGRIRATPPVIVAPNIDALLAAMKPEPALGFGAFRVQSVLQPDYALMPIHRVYQEHYAAYFPFYTAETWAERQDEIRAAEAAQAAIDAATLDRVEPGFQQSEVEHMFSSEKSETGDSFDRKWRDAMPGGWFSYQMTVDPEKPVALVLTHWGGSRGRQHDIWIDDHRLSIKLPDGQRFAFFDAAYVIPPEITKGRQTVTVRFSSTGERSGTYGLKIIETQAVTADQWAEGSSPQEP